MSNTFIDLTADNLANEHLCCIIRTKKPHPGVEAKRQWLADRLPEGHVLRKLDAKATVFIEYAPCETAWVPIIGPDFYYIYCLWVTGSGYRGQGHARALMESCIAQAKSQDKSGICMLGCKKQKAWLSNQDFARKFGFETVDSTPSGYELLALSLDGTAPRFTDAAKRETIDDQQLTIYYDLQCPYILQSVETVQKYCCENNIPLSLRCVDTLEKAKSLPCVFNNWAVFYRGKFETVNLLLDISTLKRILNQ